MSYLPFSIYQTAQRTFYHSLNELLVSIQTYSFRFRLSSSWLLPDIIFVIWPCRFTLSYNISVICIKFQFYLFYSPRNNNVQRDVR